MFGKGAGDIIRGLEEMGGVKFFRNTIKRCLDGDRRAVQEKGKFEERSARRVEKLAY